MKGGDKQMRRKQKMRAILLLVNILFLIITVFNFERISDYLDFMMGCVIGLIYTTLVFSITEIQSEKETAREIERLYLRCQRKYGVIREV